MVSLFSSKMGNNRATVLTYINITSEYQQRSGCGLGVWETNVSIYEKVMVFHSRVCMQNAHRHFWINLFALLLLLITHIA